MTNKKNIDHVKAGLHPFLNSYRTLLIESLKNEGIISEINTKDAAGVPSYKLSPFTQNSLAEDKLNEVGNEPFKRFFRIATNVYKYLNEDRPSENVLFSDLVRWLANIGMFDSTINAVVNNNTNVDEVTFENEIVNLINSKTPNFLHYTPRLLEHVTHLIATKYFYPLAFNSDVPILKDGVRNGVIDLVGKDESNAHDILFEVKYRRNINYGLKDGLFQAYELLNNYQKISGKDAIMILLIYTDETGSSFEKLKVRFQKSLSELFPEYLKKIFFIPISLNELFKIKEEFGKILQVIYRQVGPAINYEFMIGKWLNEWDTFGENPGSEELEIRGDMSYIRNGEHIFNIEDFKYDEKNGRISFVKASARPLEVDSRRLQNNLKLAYHDELEGSEYNIQDGIERGYSIKYTRLSDNSS